jgi:ankyrin
VNCFLLAEYGGRRTYGVRTLIAMSVLLHPLICPCLARPDDVRRKIELGDILAVRKAFRHGNVDWALAPDGQTPLGCAISKEVVPSVRELLALGADPNKPTLPDGGATTLLLAVTKNQGTTIVRMLLAHGAHPDGAGVRSSTLTMAAFRRKPDFIQVLLRAGANPNWQDRKFGATPLQMAALSGDTRTCVLLLHHGAKVSLQTKDGQTALNAAAQGLAPNIVALLLSKGADPNHAGHDGCTPLIDAVRESPSNQKAAVMVVTMLIRHGADPALKDKSGKSAIDFAGGDALQREALVGPVHSVSPK